MNYAYLRVSTKEQCKARQSYRAPASLTEWEIVFPRTTTAAGRTDRTVRSFSSATSYPDIRGTVLQFCFLSSLKPFSHLRLHHGRRPQISLCPLPFPILPQILSSKSRKSFWHSHWPKASEIHSFRTRSDPLQSLRIGTYWTSSVG